MPSIEQSVVYDFNTALTAFTDDGDYNPQRHAEIAKPLCLKIVRHDGITGCTPHRYHIVVTYRSNILDENQVYEIVSDAVTWAANEPKHKLFPLRGDTTPAVVAPEPTHKVKIYVEYNTHVIAFTPSSTQSGHFSEQEYAKRTHALAEALANTDGVTQQQVGQNRAMIIIDTRFGDVEAAKMHMREVLTEAKEKGMEGIFPYINSADELELTFSTQSV